MSLIRHLIAARSGPGSSVLDLIGRTPLVRLHQFERETPGRRAVREGRVAEPRRLGEGPRGGADDSRRRSVGRADARTRSILDATSGNTGIAYAMVGAARGYQVKLCVPENASPERKLILRALGAELVLTDPLEGTDGAIREARRLLRRRSGPLLLSGSVQQRRRTGARTTTRPAPEIIEQTERPPDALRRRPRHERHVRRHGPPAARVQPGDQADLVSAGLAVPRPRRAEAHGVGDRAGHLRSDARRRGSARRAPRTRYEMVRRLAREEGLLVGISSGAALAATLDVAQRPRARRRRHGVSGRREKYLTETFWDGR